MGSATEGCCAADPVRPALVQHAVPSALRRTSAPGQGAYNENREFYGYRMPI